MSSLHPPTLVKRQHGHGLPTAPTGFWKPGRPAPYGNLEIPMCIGEENCDYWDTYYTQHVRHMLLMYITWGIIASMLAVLAFYNVYKRTISGKKARSVQVHENGERRTPSRETGSIARSMGCLQSWYRRNLFPQSFLGITRLQALILLMLLIYAILFSCIGIAYRQWTNPTTPPGRRIGVLEFMGDRTGCLAFTFVPLVFILSSRDNIFSLITGISYQNFNFLHRWIGRWIFIFTWIHTVFWSLELGVMYQPQPTRYKNSWKKRYWKWGIGATALLTYLFLHSFKQVRAWTGYEFFRKTHELIAVLFLGACWGHWPEMREWMIAGIAIVLFDRIIRYLRIFLIHMNWTSSERGSFGLRAFAGTISRHHDPEDNVDVLILRVPKATVNFSVGQHFFLTFPTLSLFESHPFTPSSMPSEGKSSFYEQLYIIRVLSGQTRRLAKYCVEAGKEYPLPTVSSGPYGASKVLDPDAENVQLVAGGTGVSFTLPLAMKLVSDAKQNRETGPKRVDFVWIIRRGRNMDWLKEELMKLKSDAAGSTLRLSIRLFVTRRGYKKALSEKSSTISSIRVVDKTDIEASKEAIPTGKEISETSVPVDARNTTEFEWIHLQDHHPDIPEIVRVFWESECVTGRVQVLASGPPGLGVELRDAVARCNDPAMVKRGEERGNVALWWDARDY